MVTIVLAPQQTLRKYWFPLLEFSRYNLGKPMEREKQRRERGRWSGGKLREGGKEGR